MKRLTMVADRGELVARLERLGPESRRLWGTMSAQQMVCHLADAFRFGLTEKPVSVPPRSWLSTTVLKWLVLHTPITWPRGIVASSELAQGDTGQGTRPTDLAADRIVLLDLMERFAASGPESRPVHPRFGPLTEPEWMRWGWAHVDHHLRQFGL